MRATTDTRCDLKCIASPHVAVGTTRAGAGVASAALGTKVYMNLVTMEQAYPAIQVPVDGVGRLLLDAARGVSHPGELS